MGKIGPKFPHLLTVKAEGADPPPLTVSLTVKRPFFFYDRPYNRFKRCSSASKNNNFIFIFPIAGWWDEEAWVVQTQLLRWLQTKRLSASFQHGWQLEIMPQDMPVVSEESISRTKPSWSFPKCLLRISGISISFLQSSQRDCWITWCSFPASAVHHSLRGWSNFFHKGRTETSERCFAKT